MKYIETFIVWLESVVTDPIIKFLVLCVAALLAVCTIAIFINTLKGLFLAIFGRKCKNKSNLPKKLEQAAQPGPAPETIQAEDGDAVLYTTLKEEIPEDEQDTHVQDAQNLVDTINQLLQTPQPPELDLPDPIDVNDGRMPYTNETIEGLDYQLTSEDTSDIAQGVTDKNLAELTQMLKDAQETIAYAEHEAEAQKEQFVILMDKRIALQNAKKVALETYNQEIRKASEELKADKEQSEAQLVSLTEAKNVLSRLLDDEALAIAALTQTKKKLIVKIDEARQLIIGFNANTEGAETILKNKLDVLMVFQQQARDNSVLVDENDKAIASLVEKSQNNTRILAVARTQKQVTAKKIEQLEAEEAQRLAEQQAREEAAAKAKAEAEEKARVEAEAKAKAEAEKKAQEDAAKQEAEKKAKEEAERKSAEEAEELKKQEELRLVEETDCEELNKTQSEKQSLNRSINGQSVKDHPDVPDHPLTAEEEADQARRAFEAQRERRRQEALRKHYRDENVEDTANNEVKSPDTSNVTPAETTIKPEPIVTPEPTRDFEDPMAKIRAEWEREREAQKALKDGDVDGALNLVKKTGN